MAPYAPLTFVGLGVEALTAGLVFKLVIFTEEAAAEGTPEDASSMVPDGSLALGTLGVLEGAGARVGRQTLPPVAHPRLTEIAYGALERKLHQMLISDRQCGHVLHTIFKMLPKFNSIHRSFI